jgi:hypothetical protein
MRRVVVAVVVASAGALAATCDDGAKAAGRKYSDTEIAELDARTMAAVEKNAARVCPRPPLRDTQSSASVRDAQLALAEPTGDTAA